jgi:hypothetical protein
MLSNSFDKLNYRIHQIVDLILTHIPAQKNQIHDTDKCRREPSSSSPQALNN